jgi:hypothetical protein
VIARYHLRALGEDESAQYVRHRLEVCGLERPLPFDRAALRRVHAGQRRRFPARINLLCDRAMLGAYASGNGNVTRRVVDHAAAEVFPRSVRSGSFRTRSLLAAALALAAGAGLLKAATYVGDPAAAQRKLAATAPQALLPASAAVAAVAAPVPVPVPAAPPAKPTLLRDEDDAWRELAQAWKLPLPDGEPCAALAREQVRCFSTKLSLPLIRQLARPGIVTLDTQTSQPSYAILVGLTDQTATLRAAGTEQTVTLGALADRWQGDFATLWRAPAGYVDKAKDGQGGPALEWVAVQLAATRGVPPPTGKRAARSAPAGRPACLQVAQGLPVDGQAGPLTYMQLNRASGVPSRACAPNPEDPAHVLHPRRIAQGRLRPRTRSGTRHPCAAQVGRARQCVFKPARMDLAGGDGARGARGGHRLVAAPGAGPSFARTSGGCHGPGPACASAGRRADAASARDGRRRQREPARAAAAARCARAALASRRASESAAARLPHAAPAAGHCRRARRPRCARRPRLCRGARRPGPASGRLPAPSMQASPQAVVPTSERVFGVAELPPEIQRDLPKLAISGGVHSENAAQRMLIVGGQVMSEGAEVAPGVVLEQIRPHAAVLRFRGYRFSVTF